jgi:L-threonylcarbamoyladenylate synthase
MNTIKLTNSNLEEMAHQAATIIKDGGTIIAPFDTVYGVICSAFNDLSIEKIYNLKSRPAQKTVGTAVSNIQKIADFAEISSGQNDFIASITPGKYTFILNAKPSDISNFCLRDNTIGIRIPDNQLILKIAELAGGLIAQTSINKSGEANCYSIADIEKQFSNDELSLVDLIVDGGELDRDSSPSEIWDLTNESPVKIERK